MSRFHRRVHVCGNNIFFIIGQNKAILSMQFACVSFIFKQFQFWGYIYFFLYWLLGGPLLPLLLLLLIVVDVIMSVTLVVANWFSALFRCVYVLLHQNDYVMKIYSVQHVRVYFVSARAKSTHTKKGSNRITTSSKCFTNDYIRRT